MSEHLYLFHPQAAAGGELTAVLRNPTRGITWDPEHPVRKVPLPDGRDLLPPLGQCIEVLPVHELGGAKKVEKDAREAGAILLALPGEGKTKGLLLDAAGRKVAAALRPLAGEE